MKKNVIQGLACLLLLSVALSFILTIVSSSHRTPRLELGGVVHMVLLSFCILIVTVIFFASKGRRLRVALLIVLAAAGGVLLNELDLSFGGELLVVLSVVFLYLLGCVVVNTRRLRKGSRLLNDAVQAYQEDHDGEAFLAALDCCGTVFPDGALVRNLEAGTITFQEHLACERMRVLGDMGRLEERAALLEQLLRETKRPDFAAWLEKMEAQGWPEEKQE